MRLLRARNGTRPAPPDPVITTYAGALAVLRTLGFKVATCPGTCRRKGEHTHMLHESETAGLIVYPGSSS